MAKITLAKPKLSSDELDRMLCSDTTETVSMDTGVELADVSATNNSEETNRSATTSEECSVTTNERSATTSEAQETCSATTNECSDTTVEGCSATTKTEGQRVNQWKKENRDTLRIDLPKGMKAEIQAEAKKRGCSVTTLIQRALASYCSDTTDH